MSPLIRLLPFAILCLLLIGCGGGQSATGTSSPATTGNGRATVTIIWPKSSESRHSRLIPMNAQSIVITITAPGSNNQEVAKRNINLPPPDKDGNRQSKTLFDLLPLGTLHLTAIAHAGIDGQGAVVARVDNVDLEIKADVPSEPTISLSSTAKTLTITPVTTPSTPIIVARQGTVTLGTRATDVDGNIVPLASLDLKWTSNFPDDLKVVDGVVTATKKTGKYTVTVTAFATNQVVAMAYIEVREGVLATLSFKNSMPRTLPVGAPDMLEAKAVDSSGAAITLVGLQWYASPANQDVISLNKDTGEIRALKPGTVNVTVKDPLSMKTSDPLQITVGPGQLTRVNITSDSPAFATGNIVFQAGDVVTLRASAQDKDGNQIVINPASWMWSISNKDVARVSNTVANTDTSSSVNGTSVSVTGKKDGRSMITLTETGSQKSKSITVTLNPAVILDTVDPVIARGTVNCTAHVTGSDKAVTWSVVGGDGNGKFIGISTKIVDGTYQRQYQAPAKTGTFQIMASLDGSNQKDTKLVTVSLGSGTVNVR